MSTYSAKPFTSYDGADEKGVRAEVKVVVGYGNVASLEPSGAGKSMKVSFAVENTKYSPAAWAPVDSNILKKVQEAEAAGEPIHFRIETRRQAKIDRSIPIADLSTLAAAKDGIHKSLAAVKRDDDAEWTMSQFAVTNMAEDPKDRGDGIYRASEMPQDSAPSAAAGGNQAGSSGFEPAPYITRLGSRKLNPGSIAVSVPLNLFAFVAEWDRDHEDKVGEKHYPLLVKALLSAANELQIKIYEGELTKPDLSAGSHTRARAILFEMIRSHYPITSEVVASKEAVKEWRSALVERSLSMWKWSMNEVESLS